MLDKSQNKEKVEMWKTQGNWPQSYKWDNGKLIGNTPQKTSCIGKKKDKEKKTQTKTNAPDEGISYFHQQLLCYPALLGELNAAGRVI